MSQVLVICAMAESMLFRVPAVLYVIPVACDYVKTVTLECNKRMAPLVSHNRSIPFGR